MAVDDEDLRHVRAREVGDMSRRTGVQVHVCARYCFHSSPMDMEILRLVAEDYTNAEIGRRLGRSHVTIRNRLGLLLEAYGAHSRTGLVVAALQDGALQLDTINRRVRE